MVSVIAMFSLLPPETCRMLAGVPRIIDKTEPVPARFRKDIGKNIRDLSELLTSRRPSLTGHYLGNPARLSAYLRYFFPWNLFRLCKLFAGEGEAELLFSGHNPARDGPILIADFGSGPLTLPAALWISMPSLRREKIEFRCFDINRQILKTGERLFAGITGENSGRETPPGNWRIKPVASSLTEARLEKKQTLVTAVYVYNELFRNLNAADEDAMNVFADGEAARLSSFCGETGAVLIVEPGVPRSGEFIAHIRDRFIERGFSIDAPCTHHADCPMRTSKIQNRAAKWCHFTFSTREAPQVLHDLSRMARLPKERGVVSFLLVRKGAGRRNAPQKRNSIPIRMISGAFPLPGTRYARYGCSEKGLVLLAGSRTDVDPLQSGAVISARVSGTEPRDKKSGALVLDAASVTRV
jgi:ribosomal protein RSM22 (predicted rRNA methylase)